jgi:hypothetical protein
VFTRSLAGVVDDLSKFLSSRGSGLGDRAGRRVELLGPGGYFVRWWSGVGGVGRCYVSFELSAISKVSQLSHLLICTGTKLLG